MKSVCWAFGQLSEGQQAAYIREKLAHLVKAIPRAAVARHAMARLVTRCQGLVAEMYGSAAAVSQRDLQRVFTAFEFFYNHSVDRADVCTLLPKEQLYRCLQLAIALVYYLRLNATNRGILVRCAHGITLLHYSTADCCPRRCDTVDAGGGGRCACRRRWRSCSRTMQRAARGAGV